MGLLRGRRSRGLGGCCIALLTAWVGSGNPAIAQVDVAVRTAFVDAATGIDLFSYNDAIWRRSGDRSVPFDPPGVTVWSGLCARRDPEVALLGLLGDDDAKVRTLAMLVLLDRGDLEHLPRIAALRADAAPTFPNALLNAVSFGPDRKPSGPLWSPSRCTVGEVAQWCLDPCLDAAGMRGKSFEEFWAARKEHTKGAIRLAVELRRAYSGLYEPPPDCLPAIAAVRTKVLALPTPDRELLLLALPGMVVWPSAAFATDEERLGAARALGDDVLLAALGGSVRSEDPDLRFLVRGGGAWLGP